MMPTPLALDVIKRLGPAYGTIQSAFTHGVAFDPTTSDRKFHVCTKDIMQAVTLPKLLQRLKDVAPSIRLELSEVSLSTGKLLETGRADLALGLVPHLGAGFIQEKLYSERFVCAVRVGHPRIRGRIALKQYLEESHVMVGRQSDIVEKTLQSKGLRRKEGLRIPTWLGLSIILPNTDYLATLPERLGKFYARSGDICLLELPFSTPLFVVKLHWHERFRNDSGIRWFRSILKDIST
jgi:DNA-binding transcriptional LysR family regulator